MLRSLLTKSIRQLHFRLLHSELAGSKKGQNQGETWLTWEKPPPAPRLRVHGSTTSKSLHCHWRSLVSAADPRTGTPLSRTRLAPFNLGWTENWKSEKMNNSYNVECLLFTKLRYKKIQIRARARLSLNLPGSIQFRVDWKVTENKHLLNVWI